MSRFIKPLFKWEAILAWKYFRWIVISLPLFLALFYLLSLSPLDISDNTVVFVTTIIPVYYGTFMLVVTPDGYSSKLDSGKEGKLHHMVGCPKLLVVAVRTVYSVFIVSLGLTAFMLYSLIVYRINTDWNIAYVVFQTSPFERNPWRIFIVMIYIFGVYNAVHGLMWEAFAHKHNGTLKRLWYLVGSMISFIIHLVIIMWLFAVFSDYAILGGLRITAAIVYALAVYVVAAVIGIKHHDNKAEIAGEDIP